METPNQTDIKTEPIAFTDREIFIKLWSQPRMVFRYLHDYRYDKYTQILLILAAITKGFDRAILKSMGDTLSLPAVLAGIVLAGGLVGWITWYIYAALMSWIGTSLQGKATTRVILRVMAYAMFPMVIMLILDGLRLATFGKGIFESEMRPEDYGIIAQGIYYISLIFEITLSIWTICLMVTGISEVQKFSIGKSILNLLLPGLLIAGVVLIFVLGFQ